VSDAVERQVEGQKEVQEQATHGNVHAAQVQGAAQQHESRADLIETTVKTDLEGPQGLENINARDFPLANLDDADVQEARWNFEIYRLFDEMRLPHPGSAAIGPYRVWASHGEEEPVFPPGMDEFNASEQFTFGSYTRATRGHQMAQQETSAKQIQESRLLDIEDAPKGPRAKNVKRQ
jgi:hypothetical protein